VKGNVRWIHKGINQLKSDFKDNELLFLCKLLIEYNNKPIEYVNMDVLSCAQRRLKSPESIKNMIKGNPNKKPVNQFNLNMKLIKSFSSINEASKELNLRSPSGIISCCKGRQNSSLGFIWKYK
jgi:hypothetical protein